MPITSNNYDYSNLGSIFGMFPNYSNMNNIFPSMGLNPNFNPRGAGIDEKKSIGEWLSANAGKIAGFGLAGAGLIGALGVDNPTPVNLTGAKNQYGQQIQDLQQMKNETQARQFGSDLPQVKYALEAIRRRFAQGQQQQQAQLTRAGVSQAENPLLYQRLMRTGNVEQARAEGSTTAALGSEFEQRKQQELMQLLGYMGQARQGYANLLATEAQIKAQQEMMEQQAAGGFWGNLISTGIGIAGLL